MMYPNTVQFFLVCLVFIAGFSSCGQDRTNDDTSKPADDGTTGEIACEPALAVCEEALAACEPTAPK